MRRASYRFATPVDEQPVVSCFAMQICRAADLLSCVFHILKYIF